jgi:hypothetical protein
LFAYYPNYVVQAYDLLFEIEASLASMDTTLTACVLGAGPGPEVVALASYSRFRLPGVKTLNVHMFDRDVAGWRMARDISRDHVLPVFGGPATTGTVRRLDLGDSRWADQVLDRAATADLVLLQNCLNEIPQTQEPMAFAGNVAELLGHMKIGSVFVIACISGYARAAQLAKAVERRLPRRSRIVHGPQVRELQTDVSQPPSLLSDHFYGTEQMPRRNPYRWRYLGVRVEE